MLPRTVDVIYELPVASIKSLESPKSDKQAFPLSLMRIFDCKEEVSNRGHDDLNESIYSCQITMDNATSTD